MKREDWEGYFTGVQRCKVDFGAPEPKNPKVIPLFPERRWWGHDACKTFCFNLADDGHIYCDKCGAEIGTYQLSDTT